MRRGIFTVILRSLVYYRLSLLYQVIVIAILAAIITGSMLTGSSVRESLRSNNEDRIGNTGFVISSGLRYFDATLAERITTISGNQSVAITELSGWARGFTNGETALNCQIIGADNDFFKFHNPDSKVSLMKGEAVINKKLSLSLNVGVGDEIVVRFGTISSIPADSPFSPEESSFESLVLTISQILDEEVPANFSLATNQIKPKNIFIHRDDLKESAKDKSRSNRLLIEYKDEYPVDLLKEQLTEILIPSDLGLAVRESKNSSQVELISDRIFIDQNLVAAVQKAVEGAEPLITYLANSITKGENSTPYSFVSALPTGLFSGSPERGSVVINSWLASDLNLQTGDSIDMVYYINGPLNSLNEEITRFKVGAIVDIEGIWGDASLMPEFPGISGSESCSRWDAGVPVEMDNIREKDEEYWNIYSGTPKAFINYDEGREIWGNNFGPATAIRFPISLTRETIIEKIRDRINPLENGFTITDSKLNASESADNSVDFTTLFLSLGFFIIISAIVLLVLILSTSFETRKDHLKVMRAIGFSSKLIKRILLTEMFIIALIGGIIGVFAGQLFNILIIKALNSVWMGAVQTDTLSVSLNPMLLISGFFVTLEVASLIFYTKVSRYLKKRPGRDSNIQATKPSGYLKWLFVVIIAATIISLIMGLSGGEKDRTLLFLAGTMLFISSLLFYYLLIIKRGSGGSILMHGSGYHSWKYYASYPSRAITPILFIAAGLFIVISTGANRKSFNTNNLSKESGTGGYILWAETATPLTFDLNSNAGKNEYGLIDNARLANLSFIQGRVGAGDDASCLNLNQVKAPPLLGIDAMKFSLNGSFAFDSRLNELDIENPWDALDIEVSENCIYGIVDQTVLQWSLKIKVGDTLTVATESGEPLHIIVAAGLSTSVFQGYIIIGEKDFSRYIPSASGSNLFLVDGDKTQAEDIKTDLTDLLSLYGVDMTFTWDRLAEFNQVSNTYLTVFTTLGGFGMLLGIIGLAFVLLRNFNLRKGEFALMVATGLSPALIKRNLFLEHFMILSAGVLSGTIPALLATLPSLSSGADVPVKLLILMIIAIVTVGTISIVISSRTLTINNLVARLRGD
jgi:ABC-type antimicrobial peptide transport system permease subunit